MTEISEWEQSFFPKDKEIWIKVKSLDSSKCFYSLRLSSFSEKGKEFDIKRGFEVNSIYIAGIHPSLQFLQELKEIIDKKIEEIK